MQTRQLYYKSDFQVILESEGGWTGAPFRLALYTDSPRRCHVASFDGTLYQGCHLTDDGRLCIGVDNRGKDGKPVMGFGTVMCDIEFFLDNQCYQDGVCNAHIEPFPVICHDPETGEDYNLYLDIQGASTLQTIGTLPAFYQRGERGEKGEQGPQGIPGRDGQDGAPGIPGRDGQDGAPGRDGKDGGILYPSYKVDPHNMHLYSDTDTNRVALSTNKHFTVTY